MNQNKPLGRVMLVDDEPFDQKMYRRIIERSDLAHEVIGFTMATDAVAYLADDSTLPVDLILLDIRMPKMNGFEFVDAAHRYLGRDYDTPVVMMLTTSLSPHDRARALANDRIKGFLNKPLTEAQLLGFVQLVEEARADLKAYQRSAGAEHNEASDLSS